ncbi:rhodanese-like domain-containing protein [Arthrobacter sp. Hz1]
MRDDVENAIRDLSRIGIDSPDAVLGTDPHELATDTAVVSYPRVGWDEMLTHRPDNDTILDVRGADEYTVSHIPGAVNIPVHELITRMDEVPPGKLWIHCGSGYRSGVGASLLQRAGKDVVHIDAMFGQAEEAGIPLEQP